jgi:hypothetical protein
MSARTNYQFQQTVEPEDPFWPDNLREPVRGNCGPFDGHVKNQSLWAWEAEHIVWYRRAAAVVILTLAAAVQNALATLCQGRRKGEWGELGKDRTARTAGGPDALWRPADRQHEAPRVLMRVRP